MHAIKGSRPSARGGERPSEPASALPPAVPPGYRGRILIPLFPLDSFTPTSVCPHHGLIRRGSSLVCMVCHASGLDFLPWLQRDSRSDPRPERKRYTPPFVRGRKETRRERRARLFQGAK